jgi:hypothetical protein
MTPNMACLVAYLRISKRRTAPSLDGVDQSTCRAAIIPLELMEYRGEPYGPPVMMPDELNAASGYSESFVRVDARSAVS